MARFDEEFDFVVVGSGGGSMAAALFMRSVGKSVVILEKTGLLGGTTARSGGVMWIPDNCFMAEDGVADSHDNAVRYLEATAGQSENAPGTSPERRKAYAIEAPAMVDFLVGQGIKLKRMKDYPDYYDDRPGGSVPGRTVVAELFDARELGPWERKLRPNFLDLPGSLDELFLIGTFKRSWIGRKVLAAVLWRGLKAKVTGRHWVTCGAALQGRMLQAVLREQVDLRTDAGVTSFICAADRVAGVVTAKDGREWRIGARCGVLVNAGGFSQNQAMRDLYQPGTSVKWTGTIAGDTGEMIQEMIKLGAGIAQMEEMVGTQMIIPPGRENVSGDGVAMAGVGGQMDINKPHAIVVDRTGVRYMNEGGSYMEFCQKLLRREGGAPSWVILDAQYMKTYLFCGTMPGARKPRLWYDSGFLKRADTIEALAAALDIVPTTLRATVDRFNADVRAGKDGQFQRGERSYDKWLGDPLDRDRVSATLGTIEQGPFYAAPVVPGDVGTYGGVITDDKARVLREDGSVITGLYATGIATASVMGRYYPGAGASIGPSFTWGYVAAKHAAGATIPARLTAQGPGSRDG